VWIKTYSQVKCSYFDILLYSESELEAGAYYCTNLKGLVKKFFESELSNFICEHLQSVSSCYMHHF